jgi:2-dehydro-3-deoxygluconokinase
MVEVATFGETMLRLSPPAGKRIESADSLECRTAGAESNVAIAAARLGTETAWLSKLPDSVLGRRVASDVRSHGVDPRVVWTDEGRQGTYYIEPAGEPRGSNVIYDRADAAVTTATPDEFDTDVVADADVFFTTGITPALSETLFETTERLLTESGTVGFDLNYRSKLWSPAEAREAYDALLPSVDLLFAPERDARSILDISGEPADMVELLQSRYGCDTVVLTRGDEGAIAGSATGTVEQPAFEADTVDPIGTGDAFVGAYLSRYVQGASTEEALRWGAATAALKRTIAGDIALVSKQEVAAVLEADAGGIDR